MVEFMFGVMVGIVLSILVPSFKDWLKEEGYL